MANPPAPSEEIEGMLRALREAASSYLTLDAQIAAITIHSPAPEGLLRYRLEAHDRYNAAESALRTAFSSLREDRERLDWIDRDGASVVPAWDGVSRQPIGVVAQCRETGRTERRKTVRAAIDAARVGPPETP